MYLNYYKESEQATADNTTIVIILCSGKNEVLVKFVIMGLSQQVFVSKYLINLPCEKELQMIMENEKRKLLWYFEAGYYHHTTNVIANAAVRTGAKATLDDATQKVMNAPKIF